MKDKATRKEKSWPYAIFVDCSFRCLLQVLFAAASTKALIKVETTVMERGSGNEAMDKILWSILNHNEPHDLSNQNKNPQYPLRYLSKCQLSQLDTQ